MVLAGGICGMSPAGAVFVNELTFGHNQVREDKTNHLQKEIAELKSILINAGEGAPHLQK